MIDIVHIHPMIVHFPIVLYLVAAVIAVWITLKGGNLASGDCLARTGFAALFLAAVSAALATTFGDIAYDHARDLGFPMDPLEEHEELGFATLWVMLGLMVWQGVMRWRRRSLSGLSAKFFTGVMLIGAGVLLVTAYHGGELVYQLGVNVAPVVP